MTHNQALAILDDIALCWLSGMELWEVLDRYEERFKNNRNVIRVVIVKRYDLLETSVVKAENVSYPYH